MDTQTGDVLHRSTNPVRLASRHPVAGGGAGIFTVGDFSLFVSYLGWLTIVTSMFGSYLIRYRQTGVSIKRLMELMPGAPTKSW